MLAPDDVVSHEGEIVTDEDAGAVLEVVEGMQFDRGFLSPYFIKNEDAFVLLVDRRSAR